LSSLLIPPRPPTTTLFPYTTLFRSLPKDCFTTHTLIHHQLCKFDDTFHVTEEEQEEALHFQWWGGPFLVSLYIIPWVLAAWGLSDRKSTRLNSSHRTISYAVFCLKK